MSVLTDWQSWLLIVAGGMVTLAIRASFMVLPAGTRVPAVLQRSLKYVAAAVLPALIVPDVLFRELANGHAFNGYRIVSALVATLVALGTRSIIGTLAAGMATLWLLKWWGPF
ncbi:MAG: AzlD domain-containing protein [Betaproteobacteria bacterium]|nr:AzlD domain-containing protein [Betaproteobacteria bacterium]